jgi:hypothetical protein
MGEGSMLRKWTPVSLFIEPRRLYGNLVRHEIDPSKWHRNSQVKAGTHEGLCERNLYGNLDGAYHDIYAFIAWAPAATVAIYALKSLGMRFSHHPHRCRCIIVSDLRTRKPMVGKDS